MTELPAGYKMKDGGFHQLVEDEYKSMMMEYAQGVKSWLFTKYPLFVLASLLWTALFFTIFDDMVVIFVEAGWQNFLFLSFIVSSFLLPLITLSIEHPKPLKMDALLRAKKLREAQLARMQKK